MSLPILCISGATSTGKSTIATALCNILLPLSPLTLHQDDFFLPAAQLPKNENGLDNWDSEDSLNWDDFLKAVNQMRRGDEGKTIGLADKGNPKGIEEAVLEGLERKYAERIRRLREKGARIGVVEGFMCYLKNKPRFWDLGLFFTGDKAVLKARREARDGYATLEGWWQDPPGYFDEIVWPGYVESHGWLFKDGVEGDVDEQRLQRIGVKVVPKSWDLERILEWTLETVVEWLELKV